MTPQEVAATLTAIAAVDDRVDPDQMRIAMWHQILDSDLPLEFARVCVVNHYATQRSG